MPIMPTTGALAIVLTALLFCGPSFAASDEEPATDTTETSAADVQTEMAEAWNAIKDYTVERRDEAVAETQTMLNNLDDQIDQLEQQAAQQWDSMQASAQKQWYETMITLRKQRLAAAEWYGAMQHSSQEAWEDVKAGFGRAYEQLSGTVEEAQTEADTTSDETSQPKS